jgi:hypothetical protein
MTPSLPVGAIFLGIRWADNRPAGHFIVLLVIYEMITYAIKPKARPDA